MGSKHWCFTLHADTEQTKEWASLEPGSEAPLQLYDPGVMDYMLYQVEACSTTGKIHLQGYFILKKQSRMNKAKTYIGATAHIEKSRGTPEQNKAYCSKSDTRISGPWEWGQCDTHHKGHRTDLDTVSEKIKSGSSLVDIARDETSTMIRYSRGIQVVHHLLDTPPMWRNVTVTVLWGPTGCGKTRSAYESCTPPPYFVVMPAQWWDGYTGQDTIIFDDFYGQIRMADMLRYLDGYPVQLPIKGAFVWAKWTRVWITSNTDPDSWYTSVPAETIAAFRRRVTEVIHMGV